MGNFMDDINKELKKHPNKYLHGKLEVECPECNTKQVVKLPAKYFTCSGCGEKVEVKFDIK